MDARCPEYVREAYAEIRSLAAQGEVGKAQFYTPSACNQTCFFVIAGLRQITEAFQLCTPLTADKV